MRCTAIAARLRRSTPPAATGAQGQPGLAPVRRRGLLRRAEGRPPHCRRARRRPRPDGDPKGSGGLGEGSGGTSRFPRPQGLRPHRGDPGNGRRHDLRDPVFRPVVGACARRAAGHRAPTGLSRTPCTGNSTCPSARTPRATARTTAPATLPSCAAAPSTSCAGTPRTAPSPSSSSEQAGTTTSYEAFSMAWRHEPYAIALAASVRRQGNRYRLFVNIQTDVGDMLIHGPSTMREALRQDIRRNPRTSIP